MDLQSWLFNQAPAVVLLALAVIVLWRTYQAQLVRDTATDAWRSNVSARLTAIEATLEAQSRRISQVEYLVGLYRGRSDSTQQQNK